MKLNLTESFTKLLKQLSLNENDLYCRTCGKLLADKEVLEKLVWNGKYNKRGYPTLKNLPTFYNEIQWVIPGRIINNKLYHRHTCWNCYVKVLFEHEDVHRRAKKSSYYKKLVNEGFAIPMSSCTPNSTFKYLFDVTDDDLAEEKLKFDTASKESWIRRHGEEEGLKKYEEYRERQRYTASSEYFIKEKGMTPEQAKAFHATRACTKDNFIKRYGEEDGLKRWNEYCAKEAYVGNSLLYFIEKYGEEMGTLKYKQLINKKSFLCKTYSDISQQLFKALDKKLGKFAKLSRWEKKNFEYELFINQDNINRIIKVDYYLNGKIIEFNGDYWHANPSLYNAESILNTKNGQMLAKTIWKKDKRRYDALTKLGYKLHIVWECDYKNNPNKTIEDCIRFLKYE